MNELILAGCRPTPLAHYLKALGVLRLVSEQKDFEARAYWYRDRFVLRTSLTQPELETFFLEEYRATPLVAPWNGGSGFYPKDNEKALAEIRHSSASRLTPYRETIEEATRVLEDLGISEKVGADMKPTLLESCRARFADEALHWLDAAFVLSNEGAKYPPLLGTGGNDGRLEFTNNFMQRLVAIIDTASGGPTSQSSNLLNAALFDDLSGDLLKGAAIGQFLPERAGGANAGTGFTADSLVNPWDFVLMLEGACVFAASSVRRMPSDSAGELSAPFTVRSIGTGYGSASDADESSQNTRGELWLPLWQRASTANEIARLFSEGRVRVGSRAAKNGVDFSRAIASLGVDRGLSGFERYGFQVRNGLSYFAIPLGRFPVRAQPRVGLLDQIDGWLDKMRQLATADRTPGSVQTAFRQLDNAIMALCTRGDALRVQGVLVALGRCERSLVSSRRWTVDSFAPPVPLLDPCWLKEADDGSVEYRLAVSLASLGANYRDDHSVRLIRVREQFEPIRYRRKNGELSVVWNWDAGRDVAWGDGDLVQGIHAVLQRRLLFAVRSGGGYRDTGFPDASLGDVADFIEGRTDDQRLEDLLHGLLLLDWSRVQKENLPSRRRYGRRPFPSAFYSLLKTCFPSVPRNQNSGKNEEGSSPTVQQEEFAAPPVVPRIQRLAAVGNSHGAIQEALKRLRGSGMVPALKDCSVSRQEAQRASAALLFPLGQSDQNLLRLAILRPQNLESDRDSETTSLSTQEATL